MSVAPGRQGAIAFFVTFCVLLVALAIGLNVQWVLQSSRQVWALVIGIPIFAAIITGLILYTTFLVREIRRNEQKDAFINAVTHELKTPVTSIKLHLETLKSRDGAVPDDKRREFYGVMLDDTDRLMQTIEQVLRAGEAGKELYKARVGGGGLTFSASPLASNGRIYAMSEDGDVVVFAAADEYKELAKNSFGEMSLATPAIDATSLYVRTATRLYKMASK